MGQDAERILPPEGASDEEVRNAAARVVWGGWGHRFEYTVNLPIITNSETYPQPNIPSDVSDALQQQLGERWGVSNRGSRLEIMPFDGVTDHELVASAVMQLVETLRQV